MFYKIVDNVVGNATFRCAYCGLKVRVDKILSQIANAVIPAVISCEFNTPVQETAHCKPCGGGIAPSLVGIVVAVIPSVGDARLVAVAADKVGDGGIRPILCPEFKVWIADILLARQVYGLVSEGKIHYHGDVRLVIFQQSADNAKVFFQWKSAGGDNVANLLTLGVGVFQLSVFITHGDASEVLLLVV